MFGLRHAGLMAGGTGSRLRAQGVTTPKPFVRVGGRPVVSYFLDEAAHLGVTDVSAAVRADDDEVMTGLAADRRFEWNFIPTSGEGTFEAVRALSASFAGKEHLISTCDVVLPIGSLGRLVEAARRTPSRLMTVLGTDLVHDSDPIWIHCHDADPEVVTGIGKGISASSSVFGNVRWVGEEMWTSMGKLKLSGVKRDTQFMATLVSTFPGAVGVYLERDVIDVDDLADLDVAERLVRTWSEHA
ncbi:NTP transferase domain-containing protein [Lentzea sp. NPDC058436]|uniref:NTP transferase domain-containing protein n=1 Tax=Lentzea sp. NPDC058436 TaxID=3346499 RepID=UPI0036526D59